MQTVDLLTDPATLVSEDGGCVCVAVEPDLTVISRNCPVHQHLLLDELEEELSWSCNYVTVYGGERWCDTHDSTYPCVVPIFGAQA